MAAVAALTGRTLRLLPLLLALAACSSAVRWTPDYHVVREGETLFSIAERYGLDFHDLARWNRLGDGRLIYPGQRLSLKGPARVAARSGGGQSASAPRRAAVPVQGWRWPADGPVIAGFHSTPKTQSGIQIGGRVGAPVRAAAAGEVVYAGSGLKSYGQLVIIKHNASYLSAYGHNRELLVREGQRVGAGEPIARMGLGPGNRPLLHFEIRRDGRPVDPLAFLPRR